MQNGEPPRADVLALALAQYEKGHGQRARALCSASLEADPRNPHALCLMARLSLDDGDALGAEKLARQAIAILEDQADFHNVLGRALNNRGRLREAEEAFNRALTCDPGHVGAINNLGHVKRQQGELSAALDLFEKATAIDPSYADAWHNLGITHQMLGQPGKALRALRRTVEVDSDNPSAHFNLGNVLSELGRSDQAVAAFQQALKLRPKDPDALSNLGAAYQREGDIESAKDCFERALALESEHGPALAALAGILDLQGDTDQGLALLHGVMAKSRAPAVVVVAYAQLCRRSKQSLEAAAAQLHALDIDTLPFHLQHTIHFTLGDLYDELGRYDQAFHHYRIANDQRKGRFDPDAYRESVDRIIAGFGRKKLDTYQRSGCASELPVFIIGMPRSGTTLVEQILASHPLVHGAGELPAIGRIAASLAHGNSTVYPAGLERVSREALAAVAEGHVAHLRALAPQAERITDKMWQNFEHLGLIELLFPRARIIHCSRNPLDTGLSCYFQSFGTGGVPFSFDLTHIGFYYSQYKRLISHWERVSGLRILNIRYEELVDQQEAVSRRLIDFVGLAWDPACLRFHEHDRVISTASYAQVKRPIYRSSVDRYRHYSRYLDPLVHALNEYDAG